MSTTPTPPNGMVSNTELILRKILGEDVTPLPPNSRVEFYLMLVKDLIAQLQSAVNLRGETTTPLTDNATTNPIMIDGKSYTAVMNDAVIYQSGEFIFDGTKWHELGDLSNLTSANIGAMTGYSKPSETSAIVVADTLNAAIGKLEKALDLKQATIDSDHKLSADNVDDTNSTNKFATQEQLDQINTNKNNISTIADSDGVKNILDYSVSSGSIEGLSWTVNDDKSITIEVTGTHAKKDIVLKTFANGVGNNMVLSGCPSGGNISTGYALYASNGSTAAVVAVDTGSGVKLSYNTIMFVAIVINVDVPVGTYTFKPMICAKTIWDVTHTYQPYAMSNAEITAWIKAHS